MPGRHSVGDVLPITPTGELQMARFVTRTALMFASLLLVSTASYAQLFRAYLASYGNDASPCTAGAPCRLLPAALNAVASGGEIWILDSANFNTSTVTITKDVSILAIPGQVGSVVAIGSGPALSIVGGLSVNLRNLVIVNIVTNPGTDGIVLTGASTLTVEESVISVLGTAIDIPAGGTVAINNSSIRDSAYGVRVVGDAFVDISHTKFANIVSRAISVDNFAGSTISRVGVTDAVFANVGYAVFCQSTAASATARATVTRSSITNASYGVLSQVTIAGGIADCTVGDSVFNSVGIPLFQSGTGAILGTQGNNLNRHGGGNSGTITNVGSM